MTAIEKVLPDLRWFVLHMKAKLRQNQHKGDYSMSSELWLLARLLDEVGELVRAINDEDVVAIQDECADMANFAMMLASGQHRSADHDTWLKKQRCPLECKP